MRSGANLRGVVSFHDCLAQRLGAQQIAAKILMLYATTIRRRRGCSRWRRNFAQPAPTGSPCHATLHSSPTLRPTPRR
jgi:hypothetical protein